MLYKNKLIRFTAEIIADLDYLRTKEQEKPVTKEEIIFFIERDLARLMNELKQKDIQEIEKRIGKITMVKKDKGEFKKNNGRFESYN